MKLKKINKKTLIFLSFFVFIFLLIAGDSVKATCCCYAERPEDRKTICIDVEHCNNGNYNPCFDWAKGKGYKNIVYGKDLVCPDNCKDSAINFQNKTLAIPKLSIPIPGLNLTSETKSIRVCAECQETVAPGQNCPDDKCARWTYEIPWIGEYVFAFYRWAVAAIAVFAVLIITYSGFQMITAAGRAEKVSQARDSIFAGIIGLIILLIGHQLLSMVDPRLTILKPIIIGEIKREEIILISQENIASEAEMVMGQGTANVPLFKQWDSQWANHQFGSCGTIKSSGCGPTSLAMVLKYYGQNVNPANVADKIVSSGFRACSANPGTPPSCSGCNGTSHGAFTGSESVPKKVYGFNKTEYLGGKSNQEAILRYLREGKPIIAAMGKSIFTNGGHFIVLTGIDSSGNILINDPNKNISLAKQEDVFCCLTAAFYIAP